MDPWRDLAHASRIRRTKAKPGSARRAACPPGPAPAGALRQRDAPPQHLPCPALPPRSGSRFRSRRSSMPTSSTSFRTNLRRTVAALAAAAGVSVTCCKGWSSAGCVGTPTVAGRSGAKSQPVQTTPTTIIAATAAMPGVFGGRRVCSNRQVRTDTLDAAVWREVEQLLRDPGRLMAEYQRRLNHSQAEPPEGPAIASVEGANGQTAPQHRAPDRQLRQRSHRQGRVRAADRSRDNASRSWKTRSTTWPTRRPHTAPCP